MGRLTKCGVKSVGILSKEGCRFEGSNMCFNQTVIADMEMSRRQMFAGMGRLASFHKDPSSEEVDRPDR